MWEGAGGVPAGPFGSRSGIDYISEDNGVGMKIMMNYNIARQRNRKNLFLKNHQKKNTRRILLLHDHMHIMHETNMISYF